MLVLDYGWTVGPSMLAEPDLVSVSTAKDFGSKHMLNILAGAGVQHPGLGLIANHLCFLRVSAFYKRSDRLYGFGKALKSFTHK